MKFYTAMQHNLAKALYDIRFPITKQELIDKAGSRKIQTDFDKTVELREIFEKMPLDRFSCAGELYNNISCAIW